MRLLEANTPLMPEPRQGADCIRERVDIDDRVSRLPFFNRLIRGSIYSASNKDRLAGHSWIYFSVPCCSRPPDFCSVPLITARSERV